MNLKFSNFKLETIKINNENLIVNGVFSLLFVSKLAIIIYMGKDKYKNEELIKYA